MRLYRLTTALTLSKDEKHRALQNILVKIAGLAQTIEESFESMPRQLASEIAAGSMGDI